MANHSARERGSSTQRERGAAYTLFIISISLIILATASLLTSTTQSTYTHCAVETDHLRAREGAFAGVRWAAHAAARTLPGEAEAILQLSGVRARVSYQRVERDNAPALVVQSRGDSTQTALLVEAVLRPVEGEYRLERFQVSLP